MLEKVISGCNYILLYSFYALFFLVPLTFTSQTYELFEFNKMWLTFGLTIIIVASWFVKMILQGKITIQKTLLDIPILLFLLSQIVSTIFSLDLHTSLWGYYSRFNGGLLSIISYVVLYYAFVNNYKNFQILRENVVQKLLIIGLAAGTIVALWGLPSHFGYDPTCYLFRGTLDVSCWTEAFQPKLRIFSTFGQPNWLGAYLAILLPITIGLLIQNSKFKIQNSEDSGQARMTSFWGALRLQNQLVIPLLVVLFYLCLIFTGSQSGFIGFGVGMLLFLVPLFKPKLFGIKTSKTKPVYKTSIGKTIVGLFAGFLLIAFFVGHPIREFGLDRFTFPTLQKQILKINNDERKEVSRSEIPLRGTGELGGTDSGVIRKIVWTGAVNIFKAHPLVGTGVETFAFAYYQYRPAAHNLTSEWDYLYNKAHNEYLNYLATTGAFGLGSYLLMIGTFLYFSFKKLKSNIYHLTFIRSKNDKSYLIDDKYLVLGLLAGYISILVSNFLGFSVVVVNIYFYLIPAFTLILLGMIDFRKEYSLQLLTSNYLLLTIKWFLCFMVLVVSSFSLVVLYKFWLADTHFAKGYNFARAGEYDSAYPELARSIALRPDEPTFQDEYSYNNAILSTMLFGNEQATVAAELAKDAESMSDFVVQKHPNNAVFWKTRVRIMYALSQIDETYLPKALEAIKKTSTLAPTDAKVSYNLGILYGQNKDLDKAIDTLKETVVLKPDYADAWYALGLYYREKATDDKGKLKDAVFAEKAMEIMKYIIKTFPGDPATKAQEALDAWK